MSASPTVRDTPFPVLAASGLSLGYGDREVVSDLTLTVPPGRITSIIGANGCGKSTLLRGLARLLTPSDGAVTLDGEDLRSLPTRAVARRIGLLPQHPVAPEGITVADLVARGRAPHQGFFHRWTSADERAVAEALDVTGTADLASRSVDELSGGQRQRVWIAMTLAQETEVLLLDEPTTFLDIAHQIEILDLLVDLNAARGTTIVMVLHDMNLAARCSHHLVAMRAGRLIAEGAPREVLTSALVGDVFGLEAEVIPDPVTGAPLVCPRSRGVIAEDGAGAVLRGEARVGA